MTDQNKEQVQKVVHQNPRHLSQADRSKRMIEEAQGKIGILAVGVSNYLKSSLFPSLKQCDLDAQAIYEAYRDIWQLNAEPTRMKVSISKGSSTSKGAMMSDIRALAENASDNDRILFYFSGHGVRLGSGSDANFYLAPHDAYADDDPDALIDIRKIEEIIGKSRARQKMLILDACYSGGLGGGKKLSAAVISNAELIRYMKNTRGVAGITSSTGDQTSWAKSPDSRYSLFTYFLLRALRGEEINALDPTRLLTLDSLYDYVSMNVRRTADSYQSEQMPAKFWDGTGVPVIGDFGRSIVSTAGFAFDASPINGFAFDDSSRIGVSGVLTEMKNWSNYDQGRIDWMVKRNLATYLRPQLGEKVAALIEKFGFNTSDVVANTDGITIPDGAYSVTYEGGDKKHGRLIHAVSLEGMWIEKTTQIPALLDCLQISPNNVTMTLRGGTTPMSWVTGLKLQQWDVQSMLPEEVKVTKDGIILRVCRSSISFERIDVNAFFSAKPGESTKLAFKALGLLGPAS